MLARRRELQAQWQRVYGFDRADEMYSALRLVFDITAQGLDNVDVTEKDEGKGDAGQGKGKFKGYRTFRDLRMARAALFNVQSSGATFTRQATKGHRTEARLVIYKFTGKRIVGQTVYWEMTIYNR